MVPHTQQWQPASVNDQGPRLSKRRLGVIGLFTVLMLVCMYEARNPAGDTFAATWWLIGMLVMVAALLLTLVVGNKSLDRK